MNSTVPSNNLRFYNGQEKDPNDLIRKQNYLKELKQQMDQKSGGSKKLEQYINKLEERREIEAMNMYNPFGRGGAGAPLRDANGNLINKKNNNNENTKSFNAYLNKNDSNHPDNDNIRKRENLEKNYYSNHDAKYMNQNVIPQQQINSFNNQNYPSIDQSNLNRNYNSNLNHLNQQQVNNYPMNYMNYQNPNQNLYFNEMSNINMRNAYNNQNLNNLMTNIHIGGQNFPNTSKNRTLSANMILDQNKHIYNQNIINDINRVYEESSKVQNYNLQNDLNISSNQPINYDNRRGPNENLVTNSPPRNFDPSKLQQTNKITNYYTIEENENNYKRKKVYQDELAKQIEEKKREKQKTLQKEREMERLEEENFKIYLDKKKEQEKNVRDKKKIPQADNYGNNNIMNNNQNNQVNNSFSNNNRNAFQENNNHPARNNHQTSALDRDHQKISPNRNYNSNKNIANISPSRNINERLLSENKINNNINNNYNYMNDNFSSNMLADYENNVLGQYKNPYMNQVHDMQTFQNVITQKYESLKYKTQENINNEIDLLKREVERKNNELVEYLNSLKMDLKNYKHVKFNEQMKNMNNHNFEFVKDNYENFYVNNDLQANRNRRRRTNQYDYPENNNNNFNFDDNNNFDNNFNENENYYRNNNNNLYGNKITEKRNVNLRSSSTMIFNREEYLNERNNQNNNTSINESKITKFGSIGKNLIADSEFIPINENNDEHLNNVDEIQNIINTQNTQNNEELENLNLQSNHNLNYRDSIKLGDADKIDDNNNISDISISKKRENLDSILKDFNSVNTENKNIVKVQENDDLSQEDKITHNHLKENAYDEENNQNNNFDNELANIGDRTEINENENRGNE